MGAGVTPAPPPAALGLQNGAHWPLPPASSARPRRSKRSSIGARSSPPTPPLAVLLVARSMADTIGGFCLPLGREDASLTVETRLWRDADERREREVEEQSSEGQGRAVIGRLDAEAVGLAGGATGRRSPVAGAAKVDHTEHVPIWASCAMQSVPQR